MFVPIDLLKPMLPRGCSGEAMHTQADSQLKVWGRGAARSEIPLRGLQDERSQRGQGRSDRGESFRHKPMH